MNAIEFKQQLREENVKRYGRWASDQKRNSASTIKILFQPSPKNEIETIQHGNALAATGNYPVGTSGCFNVGISGGCGPDCYLFKDGECTSQDGNDA
jgi:hypothetical protein